MPSEQFSRHELESSILSTCPDEEPLQPRPLGELIERYGEQMVEERVHARRSVRELAQWMPPGLHAAIGPLEMGQQQLAWAIAREVAAQNGQCCSSASIPQRTSTPSIRERLRWQ